MNKFGAYFLVGLGGLFALNGLTSFSIPLAFVGGGLIFYGLKQVKRVKKRELTAGPSATLAAQFKLNDEMIQRLASRLGGKLTAEDLAKQTSLSLPEAKEKLEALHQKGVCQIDLDQVSVDGKIYYVFH